MKLARRRTDCRACKTRNLIPFLDLGRTPPANAFLKAKQRERWFPLQVNWCKHCHMVQLAHVVDQKLLFENYVYVSSTSPVFINHFEDLAKQMKKRLELKRKSLIVDIGSNDGILLKPFKRLGMRVLGIEPAKNIARQANKDGVSTWEKFFNAKVAKQIVEKHGQADLVTATNVFAHIDDLDEVVKGVKILIKPNGVFLVEVAYLVDLLKKNLFDTVYHEHVCYWAVRPMKVLVERLGLKIFDVQHVATHGGSIRVLMKFKSAQARVTVNVGNFTAREKKLNLTEIAPYNALARRVEKNKVVLNKLLNQLKRQDKTIVGYGAPAKGNTLLNYFGINAKILVYIVDDSPYKQGLLTPGTHIPVVAAERLYRDMPDYVLILAWNFAESIIKAHKRFKDLGGKFIIPVPKPEIR